MDPKNNLGVGASFAYLHIEMDLTCGLRVCTSEFSKNMCDRVEPGGGRGYRRSRHRWPPISAFANHRDVEAPAIRPASSARERAELEMSDLVSEDHPMTPITAPPSPRSSRFYSWTSYAPRYRRPSALDDAPAVAANSTAQVPTTVAQYRLDITRTLCPADVSSYDARMTPTQFRHLLAKAGLNQTQAAKVLEVTDRTMRRYVSGNTPVPKMAVWTIMRHMEQQQKEQP
jgi:hypothetical protein